MQLTSVSRKPRACGYFCQRNRYSIMKISFINFNSFGQDELCRFIAQRCYDRMRQCLQYLELHYLHEVYLHESNCSEAALPFMFLQFKDDCEQLMLLEEQLIFPYFNRNTGSRKRFGERTALNPRSLSLKHEELLERYHKIKHCTLQSIKYKEDTPYQLLRHDLQVTARQLKDWNELLHILFRKKSQKKA